MADSQGYWDQIKEYAGDAIGINNVKLNNNAHVNRVQQNDAREMQMQMQSTPSQSRLGAAAPVAYNQYEVPPSDAFLQGRASDRNSFRNAAGAVGRQHQGNGSYTDSDAATVKSYLSQYQAPAEGQQALMQYRTNLSNGPQGTYPDNPTEAERAALPRGPVNSTAGRYVAGQR